MPSLFLILITIIIALFFYWILEKLLQKPLKKIGDRLTVEHLQEYVKSAPQKSPEAIRLEKRLYSYFLVGLAILGFLYAVVAVVVILFGPIRVFEWVNEIVGTNLRIIH